MRKRKMTTMRRRGRGRWRPHPAGPPRPGLSWCFTLDVRQPKFICVYTSSREVFILLESCPWGDVKASRFLFRPKLPVNKFLKRGGRVIERASLQKAGGWGLFLVICYLAIHPIVLCSLVYSHSSRRTMVAPYPWGPELGSGQAGGPPSVGPGSEARTGQAPAHTPPKPQIMASKM